MFVRKLSSRWKPHERVWGSFLLVLRHLMFFYFSYVVLCNLFSLCRLICKVLECIYCSNFALLCLSKIKHSDSTKIIERIDRDKQLSCSSILCDITPILYNQHNLGQWFDTLYRVKAHFIGIEGTLTSFSESFLVMSDWI